jgi:hypothetical protein
MSSNDAAHVRQADASSLKLARLVQPLKDAKQFVGMMRIEPNTVVADEKDCFTRIILNDADFNFCRVAQAAVLKCVGDEIHYDLSQQGRVAPGRCSSCRFSLETSSSACRRSEISFRSY